MSPALAGKFFTTSATWKSLYWILLFFSHSVMSNSLTPWTTAHEASLSFSISWNLLKPIANIRWIMEKAREFQKSTYFCFIDYAKAFDCVDHNKLENSSRDGNTRPPDLPLEKFVCRSGSNS